MKKTFIILTLILTTLSSIIFSAPIKAYKTKEISSYLFFEPKDHYFSVKCFNDTLHPIELGALTSCDADNGKVFLSPLIIRPGQTANFDIIWKGCTLSTQECFMQAHITLNGKKPKDNATTNFSCRGKEFRRDVQVKTLEMRDAYFVYFGTHSYFIMTHSEPTPNILELHVTEFIGY